MKNFGEFLKKNREQNNVSSSEYAKKLDMQISDYERIESGETILNKYEQKDLCEKLGIKKKFNSKKLVKILDLVFRLGAAVMAIATLLLCINGIGSQEALIAMLSVGLILTTFTILPKVEK